MTSFETAFNWMMNSEDPKRLYAVEPDDPAGSHSIAGINSHAYWNEYLEIAALPQNERPAAVKNFYLTHFWNRWYAALTSDDLAKRVFDEAVNAGPETAVKLLQRALALKDDGMWGPLTVNGANEEPNIVVTFRVAREMHYREIVAKDPSKKRFLAGWLARARK
jgi:lysozyme family protein